MSDFKTRLVTEKAELSEKIEKLGAFLESEKSETVDPVQKSLLDCQLAAMKTYEMCLMHRIKRL